MGTHYGIPGGDKMSILVDERVGSREFLPLFPPGEARITKLEYGDFSFMGNGPGGMPVAVGVERKKIRELAGDLATHRFTGHQLPGLLSSYFMVYLVVEGQWGADESGRLVGGHGHWQRPVECGNRLFMASEIDKFLTTLDTLVGVRIRISKSQMETVRVIQGLYSWWNGKEWEEHHSHLAMPPHPVLLRRPTLMRAIAACFPNIGWKKSGEVEEYFNGSIKRMMEANEKEWGNIPGVGKKIAKEIVESLRWTRGW
jgi:ERCC4-type nuclease